jgi:hypothetical protein
VAAPPPEKVDTATAWLPWQPGPGQWNLKWAGHLYRRAGFGASLAELHLATNQGLTKTLELLLQGESEAKDLNELLDSEGTRLARRNEVDQIRSWWLYRMLNSGHPLREKMTLFWHNHFATSIAKVGEATLMLRQNKLLRRHALGKFEPMVQAMSKDPAMLIWLDGNSNIKGAPNENYGRELMELFTLGVGHYKEKDVREAARAFTGWHTDGDDFEFNKKKHDDGEKTILGRTGKWNGDDVVRIVVAREDCSRYLARKLYAFFIREDQAAPPALLNPLARRLRETGYDIGHAVKTILSSRLFFSDHAFRRRVKGPVEFVLGAVKAVVESEAAPESLTPWITEMGQALFAPPSVEGWKGGRQWLTHSTMLARTNFAQALAMGTLWTAGNPIARRNRRFVERPPVRKEEKVAVPEEPAPEWKRDPARLIGNQKSPTAERLTGILLDAFLPGGVSMDVRQKLVAFFKEAIPKDGLARRVREAAHAILAMPESQLA